MWHRLPHCRWLLFVCSFFPLLLRDYIAVSKHFEILSILLFYWTARVDMSLPHENKHFYSRRLFLQTFATVKRLLKMKRKTEKKCKKWIKAQQAVERSVFMCHAIDPTFSRYEKCTSPLNVKANKLWATKKRTVRVQRVRRVSPSFQHWSIKNRPKFVVGIRCGGSVGNSRVCLMINSNSQYQ